MGTIRVGTSITGLRDTIRAFEMCGVDVQDLKDVFARLADEVRDDAKRRAPKRSGNLERRIKSSRMKSGAMIYVSGTRYHAYREGLEYGRGKPTPFMRPAVEAAAPRVYEEVTQGLNDIIDRYFG